ncbi:MAG TPA: hypothetical protein VHL11_00465 [Phototrophicaceae bacterium]|jgi:hypothetical protein|nr:hypothetical protein [Phototrophicaceae bacterium]
MTRLLEISDPITMEIDDQGLPVRFVWKTRMHPVEHISKRWRVDLGWWRIQIWREHYKLTTRTGLLVIVYRDLLTGQWFLQRLYD